MRRFVLAAALGLFLPATGAAAPCVPGSLQDYIDLDGAGCTIGSALVNDFELGPSDPAAVPLDPALIGVTPLVVSGGLRLEFRTDQEAGAGEFFDAMIGYSVTAPNTRRARLLMDDAAVSGDGVITGVTDICVGDTFPADPSLCFGTQLPALIVFQDAFGNGLRDEASFSAASFFDVFTEIGIDAGLSGSARLNGAISNEFVVPEPSTMALVGAGLLHLARRRRARP